MSIEAGEFPDLAGRYNVRAVPKIVVNDRYEFTGALPESQFVDTVLSGPGGGEPPATADQTAL